MRVRLLKGQVVTTPEGARLEYHAGLYYQVPDELAVEWIRQGIAEDEAGIVTRESLESPGVQTPDRIVATAEGVSENAEDGAADPDDPSARGSERSGVHSGRRRQRA